MEYWKTCIVEYNGERMCTACLNPCVIKKSEKLPCEKLDIILDNLLRGEKERRLKNEN